MALSMRFEFGSAWHLAEFQQRWWNSASLATASSAWLIEFKRWKKDLSSNFLETDNIFSPVESNITSCNFAPGFWHITHALLLKGCVFDFVVKLSFCSRVLATKGGLLLRLSSLNRIRITFFSSLYFLNVSYTLITWTMVLCMLVKQFSSCNSSNQQLFKSIQWRIQNKFIVLGIFIIETNFTLIHLALSIISLCFNFILLSCKK